MKIEYLLIKTKNDFCSTTDQFKNLLLSNKRIAMNEDTIMFSKISMGYTLSSMEVNWKKNKETVFWFTVSTDEKNVETLEDFDMLVHRINEECGRQFKINTIWDDVSIYYTKELYPCIVEIENLLRKLIYRFMIKIAGSAWFDTTVPIAVKNAIINTAGKNDLDELPTEDQLYYADFIQLGLFFFEKYTTRPLNQNSVKDLKKILSDKNNIEDNLKSFLEIYEAKSNWERYFANEIHVDNLYVKWKELYSYRNDVAHAKRIDRISFKDAMQLIEELKIAFNQCLDHIDKVEITEEQAEAVHEVAKETISNSLDSIINQGSWKIQYPSILSGLAGLDEAASKISANLIDSSGLSKGIVQLLGQPVKYDLSNIIIPAVTSSDFTKNIGADFSKTLSKSLYGLKPCDILPDQITDELLTKNKNESDNSEHNDEVE